MLFLFVFPLNSSNFFFFQDAYFSAGTGKVYNVVVVALGAKYFANRDAQLCLAPELRPGLLLVKGRRKWVSITPVAGTGKIQLRLELLNHSEQIC